MYIYIYVYIYTYTHIYLDIHMLFPAQWSQDIHEQKRMQNGPPWDDLMFALSFDGDFQSEKDMFRSIKS